MTQDADVKPSPFKYCRTLYFVAASLLFVALSPFTSAHAQPAMDEAKVKAAFLLRFVQYVEWPQDVLPPGAKPIVIGIVGADAVAAELSQMTAGRTGTGRPMVVRPARAGDDFAAFHLLFIGDEDKTRIAQYLDTVRARPVLVVTESPGALERGSMINFVILDRRVKFEIALDATEKVGLVVSSRLLAVAVRVHKGELPATSAIALF